MSRASLKLASASSIILAVLGNLLPSDNPISERSMNFCRSSGDALSQDEPFRKPTINSRELSSQRMPPIASLRGVRIRCNDANPSDELTAAPTKSGASTSGAFLPLSVPPNNLRRFGDFSSTQFIAAVASLNARARASGSSFNSDIHPLIQGAWSSLNGASIPCAARNMAEPTSATSSSYARICLLSEQLVILGLFRRDAPPVQ